MEREFKEALAQAESDQERMRLLGVRQWMPELQAAGQALVNQQEKADEKICPFGDGAATEGILCARIHLRSVYQECLKREIGDGCAVLEDLGHCIEGNPGLVAEREAFAILVEGIQALVDMGEYPKVDGKPPTGASR
jgi:hypothetical protein